MIPFRTFYELVRPTIDEMPQPTAARLAAQVAQRFFKESRAWRVDDEFTTRAGVASYEWPLRDLEEDIAVEHIVSVTRDGRPLGAGSVYQLDRNTPDWRTAWRTPTRYVVGRGREVTLAPTPDREYVIAGELVLTTTRHSRGIPEDVFDEYEDILRDGVLGEAFAQINRPWGNPGLAQMYMSNFLAGIARVSRKAGQQRSYRGTTGYGGI